MASPVVAWVCYWIMLVTVLCWEVFELVVLAVPYCIDQGLHLSLQN